MFSRKRLKAHAKKSLKNHYFYFLILLLFASIIGTSNTSSLYIFKIGKSAEAVETALDDGDSYSVSYSMQDVYYDLAFGDDQEADEIASSKLKESEDSSTDIAGMQIGRSRGVFAALVNNISSGTFLVALQTAIGTIVKQKDVATIIFVVLSLIALFLFWVFVIGVYEVIYKRIFLEGRMYEKVPINRLMYLLRVKKWGHASITMMVKNIYLTLWEFTIIGGFIKKYSYFLVPYIIAENPGLSTKETITLSRKMMDGHKWECFKLELSLLGWRILGAVTLGLGNLFFVNPYSEACYAEYFVYVHNRSKEKNVEGIDALQDKYLYHKADVEVIKEKYADIIEMMNEPEIQVKERTGIAKFFANTFGIIWKKDEQEELYREATLRKHKIAAYIDTVNLKCYPRRLDATPESEKDISLEFTEYYRHYTVSSIIMIFFTFCCVGWLWEVLICIIQLGRYSNRGFFHGPWLPIYGSGVALVLVILYALREKPVKEFFAIIGLCGVLEYGTSWIMELLWNQEWWDYSGYFLNLNGRICAEGLLAFGIGGFAAVYFIAPLLDNLISRIPHKIVKVVCIVLLLAFGVDGVYSAKHPNEGAGITDTDSAKTSYVEKVKDTLLL